MNFHENSDIIIPLFLSIGLIIILYYLVTWRILFLQTAFVTKGEVVDSRVDVSMERIRGHGYHKRTSYCARIKFKNRSGEEHMFWHVAPNLFFDMPFVTGQIVDVYYDPKNIQHVFLKSAIWRIPLTLGLFLLVSSAATYYQATEKYGDFGVAMHEIFGSYWWYNFPP